MTESKLLEIKNLQFSYKSGYQVFDNLNLSIQHGITTGLIGANGTGKTTLLLLLCGLQWGRGDVIVDGDRLTTKNVARIRQKISMVFQNPDDQLFMPTIYENIAFGLDQLGFKKDEIPQIVSSSMLKVGLNLDPQASSHHLSLGQKKKVCLAAALARQTPLLLLDEPSNELDPRGRRELIQTLNHLQQSKIIVTHDLNFVADTCDHVVLFGENGIAAEGPPELIMSDTRLMEASHLEVPWAYLARHHHIFDSGPQAHNDPHGSEKSM